MLKYSFPRINRSFPGKFFSYPGIKFTFPGMEWLFWGWIAFSGDENPGLKIFFRGQNLLFRGWKSGDKFFFSGDETTYAHLIVSIRRFWNLRMNDLEYCNKKFDHLEKVIDRVIVDVQPVCKNIKKLNII